jgi:acyl carrier protein
MDQLLSSGSGTPDSASRETMERIRAVFTDSLHWNHNGKELSYEEMLDEAAALDSIAALEFLAAVEKEFGIELEPAVIEFEFLRDIAALASYVEDRLRKRSGTDERDQSASNLNH